MRVPGMCLRPCCEVPGDRGALSLGKSLRCVPASGPFIKMKPNSPIPAMLLARRLSNRIFWISSVRDNNNAKNLASQRGERLYFVENVLALGGPRLCGTISSATFWTGSDDEMALIWSLPSSRLDYASETRSRM
jgi:hypothetical protein